MPNINLQYQEQARKELEKQLSEGRVKKVFLLPQNLGGVEDSRNITYLPILTISMKERIEQTVYDAVNKGEKVEYVATPIYDDKKFSYIASGLLIQAAGNKGLRIDITIRAGEEIQN